MDIDHLNGNGVGAGGESQFDMYIKGMNVMHRHTHTHTRCSVWPQYSQMNGQTHTLTCTQRLTEIKSLTHQLLVSECVFFMCVYVKVCVCVFLHDI